PQGVFAILPQTNHECFWLWYVTHPLTPSVQLGGLASPGDSQNRHSSATSIPSWRKASRTLSSYSCSEIWPWSVVRVTSMRLNLAWSRFMSPISPATLPLGTVNWRWRLCLTLGGTT